MRLKNNETISITKLPSVEDPGKLLAMAFSNPGLLLGNIFQTVEHLRNLNMN